MAESRYVVAVKRDAAAEAPDDWVEQIGQLPGVSVIGATGKRAQVTADDAGLSRLRAEHGSYMHIEPIITHDAS